MIDHKTPLELLGVVSLLLLVSPLTLAQSADKAALKKFQAAETELDVQRRVALYREAIELDPTFVPAYFKLALEYKGLGDHENARRYLRKAYTANLHNLDRQLKSRILYELALTEQALGNLTAAEEALIGARNLCEDGDLRHQITLQLGQILFQQERFAESLRELARGVDPHNPEHRFYQTLIASAREALELEKQYNQAVALIRQGERRQALQILENIEAVRPGFRDVESRIAELQEAPPVSAPPGPQPDRTAPSVERTRTEPEVERTYRSVSARGSASKSQRTEAAAGPRRRPEPRSQAVGQARPRVVRPARPTSEPQKQADLPEPAVVRVQPTPRRKPTPVAEPPRPAPAARALAADKPREPSHTNGALPATRAKPSLSTDERAASGPGAWHYLVLAGVLLTLVALPLVGWFLLSPAARARAYRLTRRYERAAFIYEQMLARHPEKLWLYPELAKIYDRFGRRDERAMRVYEMLQHLDTNGRDPLTAAIIYKYVAPLEAQTVTVEIVDEDSVRKETS